MDYLIHSYHKRTFYNRDDSCENRRCSCRHKRCRILSKNHTGALREFNYSTRSEKKLKLTKCA